MSKKHQVEVLSLYNKASIGIDPIDQIILCTVETDRFGVPIGVESARKAVEVVDHLLKIVNEYPFERFVVHFNKAYNTEFGTVTDLIDYCIDLVEYREKVDGDDDVSNGV